MVDDPPGPVSRIEWVEQQLRRAILDGEFEPGQRLHTAQLSESYSVSPTPLREVLHRFSGEGLVEFIPQRGARVSNLSRRDASELSELRRFIEVPMVVGALKHVDDEAARALDLAAADLETSWRGGPAASRGSELTYRRFYEIFARSHPSYRLRRHTSLVRELGSRYRLNGGHRTHGEELIALNQSLMAAIREGSEARVQLAVEDEIRLFDNAYQEDGGGND